MSIHDAMRSACAAVQIQPPRQTRLGEWVKCPVVGKPPSNGSGRVLVFADGRAGIAFNWNSGLQQRFSTEGLAGVNEVRAPRREVAPEDETERREILATCERILRACSEAQHPYLARKGFPDEFGLTIEAPGRFMPSGRLGDAMRAALPETDGPLLVVPGCIGRQVTTLQFITAEGAKKNILRGQKGGASHRIATGRETWVCEGIATALTVRAALRLLGRSATVFCAFAAANVGKVAKAMPDAKVAADHDRPLEQLHGKGTGEFYAVASGRDWTMPPQLGDFNDMQEASGLRAVALHLREVR